VTQWGENLSDTDCLNAELNPICHLLALLGGATIVDVSGLRVKIVLFVRCVNIIQRILNHNFYFGRMFDFFFGSSVIKHSKLLGVQAHEYLTAGSSAIKR
jgi:hypothetical protein